MRRSWLLGLFLAVAAGCGGKASTGDGGGSGGSTAGSGGASGGGTGGASGGAGGASGAGGGSGGGVDCDPSTVRCRAMTPVCPAGEVPSVSDGCWGSCVPILSCATVEDCGDCGGYWCAEYRSWVTEYRCVAPAIECSALACSCLEPYFCGGGFEGCSIPAVGPARVACECLDC
ncbi:MAG: hypothetical protein IT376_13565 [Polyangiaceae bacterium]|nr:hypothetical protein [Polyangiaceae bacterium]